MVAVDTEAEFDWTGPFLRTQTEVDNLRHQSTAQEIFDRFGVRPIYLVDYAVATQPDGYIPLRKIMESQRCEIGAHLHPWITPPFAEELGDRTSFSQNLPVRLQSEKLTTLTEAITKNFGIHPVSYRAGRYGVGEEIAQILKSLGYWIDMSVQPGIDMRRLHGPDFRKGFDRPYWFGNDRALLEIPVTSSFIGFIARSSLFHGLSRSALRFIISPVFHPPARARRIFPAAASRANSHDPGGDYGRRIASPYAGALVPREPRIRPELPQFILTPRPNGICSNGV